MWLQGNSCRESSHCLCVEPSSHVASGQMPSILCCALPTHGQIWIFIGLVCSAHSILVRLWDSCYPTCAMHQRLFCIWQTAGVGLHYSLSWKTLRSPRALGRWQLASVCSEPFAECPQVQKWCQIWLCINSLNTTSLTLTTPWDRAPPNSYTTQDFFQQLRFMEISSIV